jgi:hypothetical protein
VIWAGDRPLKIKKRLTSDNSMSPLDLLSAHPWRRVLFTTYSLSLSFVEAVILDALTRAGVRDTTILADPEGVRSALMEHGARRVGRDYDVEPVAVDAGVFHPKITALTSDDETHLIVGSGNLTFNGWGGNLELFEHLHPSFAAGAFDDASGFFGKLADSGRVRHGARELCGTMAETLRAAARKGVDRGDVRLIHSLEKPLTDQIRPLVEDLGGGVRLVAVSPFWDNGAAIDRLCAIVGVDEVYIHAHAVGPVRGKVGSNWPAAPTTRATAVRVADFNDEVRLLHAKAFEVVCRRGRIVVSGSANATGAGLGVQNVEACVVRFERDTGARWSLMSASAPADAGDGSDIDEPSTAEVSILRATLEGDRIIGAILTGGSKGCATASRMTGEGPKIIGETDVADDGRFALDAPGLEVLALKGERLTLRLKFADGSAAEGFVSVADFLGVTRRAGRIGSMLLSVIAGTETPGDVAAIMAWFHDNPDLLTTGRGFSAKGGTPSDAPGRPLDISIASLSAASPPSGMPSGRGEASAAAWERFMAHLFAAFREARGSFNEPAIHREADEGVDVEPDADDPRSERATDLVMARFEKLLDVLLAAKAPASRTMTALVLTPYVINKCRPDRAHGHKLVRRVVDVVGRTGCDPAYLDLFAAAVLALTASNPSVAFEARQARARLRRAGIDLEKFVPAPSLLESFLGTLGPEANPDELWRGISEVSTHAEAAQAYVAALVGGTRTALVDQFLNACAPEDRRPLEQALSNPGVAQLIYVTHEPVEICTGCRKRYALPRAEIARLREYGVARARNCCGNIIVCDGAIG